MNTHLLIHNDEGLPPIPPAWDEDINIKASVYIQPEFFGKVRPCFGFLSGLAAGALLMSALGDATLQNKEPYKIAPSPQTVPSEYFASHGYNNSCLMRNNQIPEGPQTFDACAFVIESTDALWNKRSDPDAAIDRYFHEDYYMAGSWGRRVIGKAALRRAVYGEMRAFPDMAIHITDCSCKGNDFDGYKCMMPDVLEGTNHGPSAYGPATHRHARWTGLVESYVRQNEVTGKWQYVAEWAVHDEWALIAQLGLDFARLPHPPYNTEAFHDCQPLLQLGQFQYMDAPDAAILSAARAAENEWKNWP